MITVYNPETKLRQNSNAFQINPYYRDINEKMSTLRSKSDKRSTLSNFSVAQIPKRHGSRALKFDKAINNEIESLIKRKTWKIETKFQNDLTY